MRKIYLLSLLTCLSFAGFAQTFTYTGSVQTYTVGSGVTSLAIDMQGATGGNNNNWPSGTYPSQGGNGGRVQATLTVTPGQVLYIYVGGAGGAGTTVAGTAGYNGGGAGGYSSPYSGGGGGGATDIRTGGTALSNRIMVAGGGAGAGLDFPGGNMERGGAGGGLTGGNGYWDGTNTGGQGGFGGTPTTGGAAGSGGGTAGSLGLGGAAYATGGCGGGGGGYYGGGGGGSSWAGGGGGSSYTDPVAATSVTHTQAYNSSGNGTVIITSLSPCSGTISAGTAVVSPGAGGTTTSFTLSLTGATTGSGLTYQWYSSSTGTGSWSSISGATNATYTFTGISATTYYECIVTCAASSSTSTSSVATASYLPTSCVPAFYYGTGYGYGCTDYMIVGNSTYPFIITGAVGTSMSDPTNCVASGYIDETSTTYTCSFIPGNAYNTTLGANIYGYSMNCQMWIDFNNDGTFQTTESVGGGTWTGTRFSTTITIPTGATPGTYKMRVITDYTGGTGTGYPTYPSIPPCPTTSGATWVYYGDARDYLVTIVPPPTITAIPSPVSFGTVAVGLTSASTTITLTGAYLIGGSGNITVTAPSNFQVSLDGSTWATTIYVPFTGTTLGPVNIYANFSPTAATTYSGNINMTGGGISTPQVIPVTGTGSYALITPTPSSLDFGTIATATYSPVQYVTINGLYLNPLLGSLTVSYSSNFYSNTSGSSTYSVSYSGGVITGATIPCYFNPPAAMTYSGTMTITGGGLSSAVVIPLSGSGGSPCSGTPTAGTASISPTHGNSSTAFTLTLTGYTLATGLTFQWQSSPTGTGSWTDIAGATNITYGFTGISANTYYQCLVTCTGYGSTATSTSTEAILMTCMPTSTSWYASGTTTFTYTGSTQSWTVPTGVTSISVDMQGAKGGNSSVGALGGFGGRVQATLGVTAGSTVYINVGGAGANAGSGSIATGGVNVGGTAGSYAGGGGGASDIRIGGSALSNRMVVAAGGGGAGYNCAATTEVGGYGGGLTGGIGYECGTPSTCYTGSGGTPTAGGLGATCYAAIAGSLGTGGNGIYVYSGGGGGGYYGGGGAAYGGGGGGSSYADASATSVTHTQAYNSTGNGSVTISYATTSENPSYGVNTFYVTPGTGSALSDAGICAAASATTGYLDRTSTISPVTLYQGCIHASSVTWGTVASYQELQVWIDFNNDGTFSTSEEVTPVSGYNTTSTPNPTYFNITIPATAPTGNHLMRIRGIWELASYGLGLSSHLDPCLIQYLTTVPEYNDGDVVDYEITIATPPNCSGTPTAGTAVIAPLGGVSTTPFTLSVSGFTTLVGGISLQWQDSSSATGGAWVNISGATSSTYSFTGITTTTYYRCLVSCSYSGLSSSTIPVVATYYPASSCTPAFYYGTGYGYGCSDYMIVCNAANPFIVIGDAGTSISDPTNCNTAGYIDNSATTYTCTFFIGNTYNTTLGDNIYAYTMSSQMWIDFNSDGTFQTSESVGGGTFTSTRYSPTIAIPTGVTPGIYRMRVMTDYASGCSTSYPCYPSQPPCPAASGTNLVYYGDVRDYKVTVSYPPVCSGAPTAGTSHATLTSGCGTYTSILSLTGTTIATGLTYQWQSSPDASTWTDITGATSVTRSVTVTSTLYYRCVVTCSATGLASYSSTVNLVYSPMPSLITSSAGGLAGGPFAVCYSTTGITFLDSVSGGTWSNSPTTYGTVFSTTGVWTPSGSTGTTIITYTIGSCTTTATLIINNTAAPSTPTISTGTNPLCVYAPLTLTDAVTGGIWSSGTTSVATIGSLTGVVSAIAPGTTVITYNNGCGSANYTVTVNGSAITLSPATGFVACTGSNDTLTATYATGSGTSYSWSGPGGTSTTTALALSAVTTTAQGVYTFTTTTSSGCTETLTYFLGVAPVPTVTASASPTSICATGTSTLTASAVGATTGYTVFSIPYSFVTQTSTSAGPTGDDVSMTATIPFSFNFYGTNYTSVHICTNGYINFGTSSTTYVPYTLPSSSAPSGVVGLDYRDEYLTSPSAITYSTEGTAPYRKFVIYYYHVGFCCSYSDALDGEIILYETTNIIDFMVSHVTSSTGVMGIQNIGATAATTVPGRNNASFSVSSNEGWRFAMSSFTYTWMPALDLSATTGSPVISSGLTSTTVYTVTGVDAYGCTAGASATATVSVNPSPSAIAGAAIICPLSSITLTDSVSGGTWTSSATSIATVNSATGVVTGIASGTAVITYTVGSCSRTAIVTVNTAAPASIGGTFVACVGGVATLTDATGGGTWTSGSTGIATIGSTTGIVSGVSSGTSIITYSTACGSSTQTVTVSGTAPASITGTPTVCTSATTTLADASSGGTWSSSATGTATVGSTTGVVTGVATGTVTISYTTGCGTATMPVTVTGAPAGILGATSFCVGSTITLTDITTGGTWSSGATGVATVGSTTGIVSGVSAGTAVITYTNGCGTGTTATVTVVGAPASITGGDSLCVGSTLSLSDASTGGTWTSSTTSVATIGSTTGVVSGATVGTTTITYTTACGSTTLLVSVNGSPSSITGTGTLCAGGTLSLSDATTGGTWTSGSTGIATVGGSDGVVTGVSGGTALITYSNGCGTAATATVTVAGSIASITGPTNVCIGSTITLADASSGGTWSSSSTSIATVGSTTGIVTGASTGVVLIDFTTSCGSISYTVTVNGAPSGISGTPVVCVGSVTSLSNTTSGGTWSSSATSIATVDISGNVTGISQGVATISYNTGCGTPATLTVTVNALPASITGTTSICFGSASTLSDISTGGTWSSSATTVATVGSTSGIISGVGGGTAIITFDNGCGTPATAAVTVTVPPTAISGLNTVCVGSLITLTDTTSGGTWSSSAAGIASVDGFGDVTGVSAGIATISYSNGCGTPATQVVTVNALPTAISGTAFVCTGSTTSLTSTPSGGTWVTQDATIATVDISGVVTGVSSGLDTIEYVTGCGVEKIQVTVNTAPSIISGMSSVCGGLTITLTDSIAGGTWTSSASGVASIAATTGIVTGVTAGSVTISYTNACGAATHSVYVNSASPAGITGTASVCVSAVTSLSDVTPGGTWLSSNNSIATVDATGNVSGIAGGIDTVSYSTGCGTAATMVVTVNIPPSVISGPGVLCAGIGTITLTDSVSGGSWTSSATGVATIDATSGIVSGVAPGVATITYTASCGFTTTTVTVNTGAPGAITGTTVICDSTSTTLVDAVSGGAWSSSNTSVATISSTGVVTGVGVGTTTIVYSTGCGTDASASVTVNPLPAAVIGTSTICPGNILTLTDAVSGGTWSSSATGIANIGSATGVVTGVSGGIATMTYTLGCGFATTDVTVNSATAPITGSASVCVSGVTTLADITAGGTWSSSNPSVASIDATGVVTAGSSSGITTISYTGICTTATLDVSVNSAPAGITGSEIACVGTTTTLSEATGGGTWSSADVTIATVGSTSGIVSGVATGTVTITYNTACGNVSTVVTINGAITAITGTPTLCVGGTTVLSDATSGGTWSSAATTIATVDPASGSVTGMSVGTAIISYTTSLCGSVTSSVTVNGVPGAISGSGSVCVGSTLTLSDPTTGGTWVTGDATIATVDATNGVVTGVSAGSVTIDYNTPCGTSSTTITVNGTPTSITGMGSVCVGSTTVLSDATPSGTWSSGSPSVATIDAVSGTVTGVSVGSTLISYTTSCGTATISVMVNNVPASITGISSVCEGGTLVLSDASSGGSWNSGNISVATVSASTGIVTGVAAGYDTIYYSTGCGTAATAVVTVVASPATITGNSSLCADSVTMLSNTSAGGTWSGGTSTIATVSSTGLITGVATGVISVTYSTGCGSPAVSSITVNPLPASITGPSVVCQYTSVLMTDAGGGTWSSRNPAIATVSSGIVYGVTGGTDTITYRLPTGCAITKVINVSPFPNSGSITGASVVCQGANITLTDTAAGGSGSWTSYSTSIATCTGNIITGVSGGIDTIKYSVTNSCGTGTATKVITVNPLPNAGTISGATTLCMDSVATMTHTGASGVWSSSNTLIATISGSGVVTGVNPGVDSIIYTVTNSCGFNHAAYLITILGVPSSITGVLHVCDSTTDTLYNSTVGGAWTSSDLGTATIGGGNGVALGINPGVVTITYSTGCGTAAIAAFTVDALPGSGTISGGSSVCTGNTESLSETVTGGVWSASNGYASVSTSGLVSAVSAGIDTIVYTVSTVNCGSRSAEKIITINPSPVAALLLGTDSLCIGGTTTITATVSGGTWSINNTNATVVGGVVTGVTSGNDTVVYTVSSTYCGDATTPMAVRILPNAYAGVISGPSTVCVGSNITLVDTVSGGSWSSNTSTVATISSGVVTAVAAGTDSIIYSVTNYCSSASAGVLITVNPLPNAGTITGLDSVCQGFAITMSESVTSGIWGMTNNKATDTLGVITGISTGYDSVSYSITNMCGTDVAYKSIFIAPLPSISLITGPTAVCIGSSITMLDTVAGGTWSGSSGIATITSGGVITGISAGVYDVTYSLTTSCGSISGATSITIDSTPNPYVTGRPFACMGERDHLDTLNGAPAGGTWATSNALDTITVISSGQSTLSGGFAGLDTVTYSLSNSCGTGTSSVVVNILTKEQCDSMLDVNSIVKSTGEISVYPNPTTGVFTVVLPVIGVNTTIQIMDIYGSVIDVKEYKAVQDKEIVFNINNLASGTYMIRVTSNDKTFVGKIMVMNK